MCSDLFGMLVPARDPAALEAALTRVLAAPTDPRLISAALDVPDWRGSAERLFESLSGALSTRASEAA